MAEKFYLEKEEKKEKFYPPKSQKFFGKFLLLEVFSTLKKPSVKLIITKKYGLAVKRNKLKRQLKAILREISLQNEIKIKIKDSTLIP